MRIPWYVYLLSIILVLSCLYYLSPPRFREFIQLCILVAVCIGIVCLCTLMSLAVFQFVGTGG